MQINPASAGGIPPEYTMAHAASSVGEIVSGPGEERIESEKTVVQIVVDKKVNAEVSEGGTIDILA